jgi:hypothetical protein
VLNYIFEFDEIILLKSSIILNKRELIDYDENEIFKSSISKIIFLLIRCFG